MLLVCVSIAFVIYAILVTTNRDTISLVRIIGWGWRRRLWSLFLLKRLNDLSHYLSMWLYHLVEHLSHWSGHIFKLDLLVHLLLQICILIEMDWTLHSTIEVVIIRSNLLHLRLRKHALRIHVWRLLIILLLLLYVIKSSNIQILLIIKVKDWEHRSLSWLFVLITPLSLLILLLVVLTASISLFFFLHWLTFSCSSLEISARAC